jgi:putative oxidoreductase
LLGHAPRAVELGVPLEPELAVRLNGAIILTGGVALALGLSPRLAAGALAGSLVPTTLADILLPTWRPGCSTPTGCRWRGCSAVGSP